MGDEVLRVVAERMKAITRESDTIARFGGDEFALILRNIKSTAAIESLISKLIENVNEVINVDSHACYVGASVGVACFPQHGLESDELLHFADLAMYQAKESGRNQLCFFQSK